jgi:spore coat polysaccharide biosynthesis predicted glycosyltransferase SpsG
MREAMMRADLAICSGGQTLFELAATGLPGIAIATADNQVQNMTGFASAGTIRNAGSADDPQLRSRFAEAFEELGRAEARSDMSVLGPQIVDGQGADRTAHEIVALLRNSRSAMA